MIKWEIEFQASGAATVEADTEDEARDLLTEAVEGFDTMMLESIDVDEVRITAIGEET